MPKRTGKGNSGSNESSVDKTKSNDKIKEILALLDINNDIDENKYFLFLLEFYFLCQSFLYTDQILYMFFLG